MPDSIVALTRCKDYSQSEVVEALERQFKLLGGLEKFISHGDAVLIKPNFIAPKSRRKATQTDPAVVIETARLLKDFGAKPFVGDSPAWGNVYGCVKALKIEESLKELSVPVRQLNKPKVCRIGNDGTMVSISSIALEADVIINLPKLKSHQQLMGTFAVKNMFGCVCGKQKAFWHFARGASSESFCEFLIDVFRFLNPALTIIDGIVAMQGPGPLGGSARQLGWLIGGSEPIACENVCARLIGIEPGELPMIKAAKKMGFGCFDEVSIKTVGDDFSRGVCTDFDHPELIAVRFSLVHIFRSICKQLLLLGTSSLKRFFLRKV